MNLNSGSNKKTAVSRLNFIKTSGLTFAGLLLAPTLTKSSNLFYNVLTEKSKSPLSDILTEAKSVTLTKYIGSRLNLSYEKHILMQDVDHLVAPFRNRTETRFWQSEFWGKWFTSAVLAYRYQPSEELKAKLAYAVDALLDTQTADGYIGNYEKTHRLQQWDIWGRKYTMLGLLAYHDLTEDTKSLLAVRKMADHLMLELQQQGGSIVTKGNYRGMAASSVLEPICLLYNYSKDQKYLTFAEEIVRQWELPEGPALISHASTAVASRFPRPQTSWYSWEQGQKAYEMMSCYEGLLELYRITGKEHYKKAVEQVWENIRNTEINLAGSGASAEMWFSGKEKQARPVFHYQETCVTVTWIKLSHQLFRLTGNARYADAVEQAFYNALLGSLNPINQQWAKYTPLIGQRLSGSGQCGMQLNCCEASGPRGLFNIPFHIVTGKKAGISINYYIAGDYSIDVNNHHIHITQQTDYPKNGRIKIAIGLDRSHTFMVSLRIPSWSSQNSVWINTEPVTVENINYMNIERLWHNGDIIEIELDMRGRIERLDQHFAILRGPILLARDSRLNGPNLLDTVQPIEDESGCIILRPIERKDDNIWMEFSAKFMPESYTEEPPVPIRLNLCDYASAGYSEQNVVYKVWMPEIQDPRK